MHVNVPQFIDIEDKIAFGLTGKQLLWMAGMGATLLVVYNLFDQQAFYLIGIFVVLIFSAFAFWKPQGVTLITFHRIYDSILLKAQKLYLEKNISELAI